MTKTDNKIFQASLLVAASGILYGFLGFLGTTILQDNISIATMLFWRFVLAGSWIIFCVFKNTSSSKMAHFLDKRTLFFMFILGAIGYAGSSVFYFIASQYTGTGLAMVIFFSYPIIVALSSWLIQKKSFNKGILLTLMMMMIGFILLQDFSTNQVNITGIFFGVIAAVCYAFYVIGSKHITSQPVDENVLTAIVCFGCAFIFLLLSVSSNSFILPTSIKTWVYLIALGILATALPIQLMLKGLKYVSSMRASIISVLEPLVTVLVGIVLLDESISHLQLIGAVIILSSALLVQFQKEL